MSQSGGAGMNVQSEEFEQNIARTGNALDANSEPVAAPPPIVVVQYRSRSWSSVLLPPALILVLACGLLSYRFQSKDWEGLTWSAGSVSSAAPTGGSHPSALVEAVKELQELASKPTKPPLGVPIQAPIIPAEPSEPKLASEVSSEVTVEVSPVETAEEPPLEESSPERLVVEVHNSMDLLTEMISKEAERPAPRVYQVQGALVQKELDRTAQPKLPSAEDVMSNIDQEAQQLRRERQQLEGFKAGMLDEDRLKNLHEELEARRGFLAALTATLEDSGKVPDEVLAGRIHALPDDSRANKKVAGFHALLSHGGTGRTQAVRSLRMARFPESEILRLLEEGHVRNRVSRTGPRSDAQATIRAARDLLAVELNPLLQTVVPQTEAQRPKVGTRDSKGSMIRFPVSSRRD